MFSFTSWLKAVLKSFHLHHHSTNAPLVPTNTISSAYMSGPRSSNLNTRPPSCASSITLVDPPPRNANRRRFSTNLSMGSWGLGRPHLRHGRSQTLPNQRSDNPVLPLPMAPRLGAGVPVGTGTSWTSLRSPSPLPASSVNAATPRTRGNYSSAHVRMAIGGVSVYCF